MSRTELAAMPSTIHTKSKPMLAPIEILGFGKETSPLPPGVALAHSPKIDGQQTLVTTKPFRKGETVFAFTGPIIGKGTIYSFQFAPGIHIDPINPDRINQETGEPERTAGHWLNHSCAPSTRVEQEIIEINGGRIPIIKVTALEDLNPGTELSADYAGMEEDAVITGLECLCGSGAACRKIITGWTGLSDEQKGGLISRGIAAEYLIEMDEEKRAKRG